MSVNHLRLSRAVCLALALCAAAACGRTPEVGSSADNGGTGAIYNQTNPAPRDQVQDGGTFTWPLDVMSSNFNYNQLDGPDIATAQVMLALMQSPFMADASGTPHWNHNLLAEEPTVVMEPKQQVTYRIHPKATWTDGSPLTWEDFYWQWRALRGVDKAYLISASTGYEAIENVQRGRDDREAIVTFARRFADWRATFGPLYPAWTNRDPKVFNEGWKERPRTADGPFRFDSLDVTAKTITVVRNERWWGPAAKLDRIVYRVIEPDAQIDAVANGEIDAIDVGPDVNKFNRAQDVEGTDLRVASSLNFRHITINGTSPNLQDVRVRRALAMAISRQAITRAALGPLGLRATPLGNHIFIGNQAGYQDNSGEVGAYNPERARRLLDEAGWSMEGTVRKKDGRPLELDAVIPSAVATSKQEAELVQNMLAQVGIRLKIVTVPTTDFFTSYIAPGQFDLTMFSWMGTAYPISLSRPLYATPTAGPDGTLDVQLNFARIGTSEIDRLFEEASQELDREKARALANRIDTLLWEEVHSLPLYQDRKSTRLNSSHRT